MNMTYMKSSNAKTDNSIFWKNEIKFFDLLENALENFHIFTHGN
jgi:hypothetical protein